MSQMTDRVRAIGLMALARTFAAARNGNIGMMTALMIVPMLMMSGAAIDYGFAVRTQGRLEQAAATASTAAAHAMRDLVNGFTTSTSPPNSSHDADGATFGVNVGKASFIEQTNSLQNLTVQGSNVTATVTRTGNTIAATVGYTVQLQTMIMKLYGITTINMSGSGSMILAIIDEPQVNASGNIDEIIHETWQGPAPSVNGSTAKPVINNWFSGTAGSADPVITNPAF